MKPISRYWRCLRMPFRSKKKFHPEEDWYGANPEKGLEPSSKPSVK
jgi:hypothetical protein